MALCNTCRNSSYADGRDQFYCDSCLWVHLLDVKYKLCQILDGVDVVVRRRRNKRNARNGMTKLSDKRRDLMPGKLSAFARFRTLSNFYLDLLGTSKVCRSDAETP